MLDNDKAILLIRGEKPVIDFKYNILKHPNVKYTSDGEEKNYEYGKVDRATGKIIEISSEELQSIENIKYTEDIDKEFNYELLSEDEIEKIYLMEEYENERKKENNK